MVGEGAMPIIRRVATLVFIVDVGLDGRITKPKGGCEFVVLSCDLLLVSLLNDLEPGVHIACVNPSFFTGTELNSLDWVGIGGAFPTEVSIRLKEWTLGVAT
jgi:hypothetical protein